MGAGGRGLGYTRHPDVDTEVVAVVVGLEDQWGGLADEDNVVLRLFVGLRSLIPYFNILKRILIPTLFSSLVGQA